MKYRIRVKQECRVLREIVIEVEAESLAKAIADQEADDDPAYDDPRWVEYPNRICSEVEDAGKTPDVIRCDSCGEEVEDVVGCPDGQEVCQACFDGGVG
jgi:hypothetical protein